MMTVGVAQSRINEMNAITEELADCIKKNEVRRKQR